MGKSSRYRVLFLVLGVSLLLIAAFYAGLRYSRRQAQSEQANHPLLARRLFIENPSDILINFEPLRSKVRSELEFYGEENASFYFEYLPTGTSIRTGANTQLVGASLLKLPAVMDLYRLVEKQKINLDDQVSLKKEWLDDMYGELHKKGEGHKLSIRELARIAIEQSDNTAINGVQDIVKSHNLLPQESSFNALDVEFVDTEHSDLRLSARSYSSFMKCLYFACYLSNDNSQEILNSLSHSSIGKDRIIKYLPSDLTVAHKIGVLGEKTQADCGIVYVPNRNYTLCIMINDTQEKGSETIAQLSKFVYDYVTEAN